MLDAHDVCAYNVHSVLAGGAIVKTAEANRTTRKSTNLSLDRDLLTEAKALGINLSRSAEAGIADAVIQNQRERWLKDNAAALASSNSYVEVNGLPLARHRQF